MNERRFRFIVIAFELIALGTVGSILMFQNALKTKEYSPVVQLSHGGKIRGMVVDADHYREVDMYEGIPYGTAGRFQRSWAHPGWRGVWDATYPRNACSFLGLNITSKQYTTNTYGDDCLYMTVWKPSMPSIKPRAVMVYIYGGAFRTGTVFKKSHDGRYLAARGDVVVVGFNYRLGPFGFLYAENDAPGNAGLWDQVVALQWVKANIHLFGGDPDKVTVFGNSAGSQSIAILMHSPLQNQRLFHRAILQSGGSTYICNKTEALEISQTLAADLHCPTTKSYDMLQCLRERPIEDIMEATERLNLKFKPLSGDDLFPMLYSQAVDYPNINRDVDIMYGLVHNEGSSFVLKNFPNLLPENISLTFQEAIDKIPEVVKTFYIDNPEIIRGAIKVYLEKYSNTSTANELRSALARIRGDMEFDCPTVLLVERWAERAQMKKYYSFRVMQRPHRQSNSCVANWMGVCHSEELFYLFSIPQQILESDKRLSHVMCRAWASFAWTGNPGYASNVRWTESFRRDSPYGLITDYTTRFMRLEHNHYQMVDGYYSKCEKFWLNKLKC